MTDPPSDAEALARLNATGWLIGEVARDDLMTTKIREEGGQDSVSVKSAVAHSDSAK